MPKPEGLVLVYCYCMIYYLFINKDITQTQFWISDKVSDNAMKFQDFGITPHTVEETVFRFIRMFRPVDLQRVPFDRNIKSYAIEGKA